MLLWATLLSLLYLNRIQVKNASIYSKRAVYFSLDNERCPFANDSLFWVNAVQRLDQTIYQTSESFVNQFEWFVQFPAARAESSEAVLTQSCNRKIKNIKSLFQFQKECLCLDTISIDIFTIFSLAEI